MCERDHIEFTSIVFCISINYQIIHEIEGWVDGWVFSIEIEQSILFTITLIL